MVGTAKLSPGTDFKALVIIFMSNVYVCMYVCMYVASKALQKGDVILCIDGIRVANDGTIPFREGSFKER